MDYTSSLSLPVSLCGHKSLMLFIYLFLLRGFNLTSSYFFKLLHLFPPHESFDVIEVLLKLNTIALDQSSFSGDRPFRSLLKLFRYTIFATHMENLAELAVIYPNVKILHFDVDIRNNRLDFKFQLKDGPRHIPHYGLLLAEVAGLPSSVIETARTITSNITQRETNRMDEDCEQHQQLQMVYRVAQRLLCLKFSSQHEDSIRQALQNLKDSYLDGTL
ncbi:DNA mismatch repair protein MSH4 [Linum perenne]